MRAWTVDADDIRVAEDFDEALLHRTAEIDAFLSPGRDDKFIVIGTKGFGKTLLLKAKRILLQREGQTLCLPSGNLLDKPIGDKIFGREAIAQFAASSLPWAKVWLAAIAVTVLKQAGATEQLSVGPRFAALINDAQLRSAIDHFVRLLDFSPSELQRCATETDGHLVPRLRALTAPVALFIDGIDEYFNKHVEERPLNPSVAGELSPEVWYFAQLGLVEVAYQLRRINHRLKVFAAIRKEAYARLPQRTAMSQQYRGSAVDIAYSPESLREIFVNNIRLVKGDRMVHPARARANPLEAFLGRASIADSYTREEEDAFEYICRHTLLRPRDLMTIGERIAALSVDERSNQHRLKATIHEAATEIAHEYLAEIAPYLGDMELDELFRRLPGPVLTRAEIETIFRQHSAGAAEPRHAFSALYRVGLLGCVRHDRASGEWRQHFLRPGEAVLQANEDMLPPASHYLLHPVLSDVVARVNAGFAQRVDRVNLVGYNRPWRDRGLEGEGREISTRDLCVLKADVHGFGSLMREGADGPVRKALVDAVARWAAPTAISETRAGDAVLIVDDDPVALAQTARHLMDEVYAAPRQALLRIALHHGEVQTRRRETAPGNEIVGGEALLYAARVEPIVTPGQIWLTEQFVLQFRQRPSLWRTEPIVPPDGGERFNVSKTDTGEPDLWVGLYRLTS
jgi:class 3 adenylate cyclase